MRFDLDDEQRAIRDAVHDLCARRYAPSAEPRTAGTNDQFWSDMAASGLTQLCAPGRDGATGMLEISLAVEELGWALAPATFLGNAVAGLALPLSGRASEDVMAGIATGTARGAFAHVDAQGRWLGVDTDGAAWVAGVGTWAVWLARGMDGEPVAAPDLTRAFTVASDVQATRVEGGGAAAIIDRAEVLLAADLVGVARRALELTVTYAGERHQFGRPIGAYQAVSHRCADMLIAVESARSAVLSAAWTADHDPDRLPFAASAAKVAAAGAASSATAGCIQVHGGIGFTWEHPAHLLMRRAAATARLLGSVDAHLERVAALSGLD